MRRARALAAVPLAAALLFGPRVAGIAQDIGDVGEATSMAPGQGRAHLFSAGEKVGFALMSTAAAFFVLAWHMTGKHHHADW